MGRLSRPYAPEQRTDRAKEGDRKGTNLKRENFAHGEVGSGSKRNVAIGDGVGAVLMIAAAVCEFFIGVEAAGQSLRAVSKPLQSE